MRNSFDALFRFSQIAGSVGNKRLNRFQTDRRRGLEP
jgi:hypothetical protein